MDFCIFCNRTNNQIIESIIELIKKSLNNEEYLGQSFSSGQVVSTIFTGKVNTEYNIKHNIESYSNIIEKVKRHNYLNSITLYLNSEATISNENPSLRSQSLPIKTHICEFCKLKLK